MKTLEQIKSLKKLVILFSLTLSLGFMASCEKNEDDIFPVTEVKDNEGIKMESLVIRAEDWCDKGDYYQACLPVKCYEHGVSYAYVKVFIKVKDDGNQVYNWLELPYEETTFSIDNDRMYVQKYDEIGTGNTYFLVEVKINS